MKLIQTQTLGTSQTTIEFTSIPQTYTDLVLLLSNRSTQTYSNGGAVSKIDFNTYATAPTNRALRGQGSGTGASFTNNQFVMNASDSTSNTFSNTAIYIPNYTSSASKSFSVDSVFENNASFAETQINAQLWAVSAAITSIRISIFSGDFVAGSMVSLYGVLKGSDGIVTTS